MGPTHVACVRLMARLALILLAAAGSVLMARTARAQERPVRPAAPERTFQVFFLGNTGTPNPDDLAPTLALLRRQLDAAGAASAVVFLGDQLHGGGMPEPGAPGREEAERQLLPLVEALQGYAGEIRVIPGDGDAGETDRAATLERQKAFLESRLGRDDVFRPGTGADGLDSDELADDLRLLTLDTDLLLRGTPTADEDGDEPLDVYSRLEDHVRRRSSDDLIVVGHHPVFSNGRYGGHGPPVYLVPGLGTAYFAAARVLGDEQHFAHPRNRRMRHALREAIAAHEDVVYVSAHDLGLQHFESERTNRLNDFVVSGSAARSGYVASGHEPGGYDVPLATSARGFVSLAYYADGSIWLDAWGAAADGPLYERMLRRSELPTATPERQPAAAYPSYVDSTVTLAADPRYEAGFLRRLVLGSNRRDAWTQEVEVPVLDLSRYGGLRPVKRGGSAQTTSIRLEAPDGRQYALRSVRKDTRAALPPEWQRTVVATVGQDLASHLHPYGALAVPPLADAVGVLHANPRLVVVPDDPRLGEYRGELAGQLMILEERPDDDHWEDAPFFGNAEEIVGWAEMYRAVTRDNDDRVDARALARNRLFDFWMGDWDRHRDQWRWAAYDDPDGKGTLYRPIPRDRDAAFNKIDFLFSSYFKSFLDYNTASFDDAFHVKALSNTGRPQDHRFLNELDLDDWRAIADSVRAALTDEAIEAGLRALPPAVYAAEGNELLEIGRRRRDELPRIAEDFYRLHARSVDVVGSDKHERFEVTRRADGSAEVVVYKTSKEGEVRQELYRRVLRPDETREVNLYGLGGDDRFIVRGPGRRAIRVNAVGGPGRDQFADSSRAGRVHFRDTSADHSVALPGSRTGLRLTDDPADNLYGMEYRYERVVPVLVPGYTTEDGVLLRGGATYTRHAFGKEPFAQRHAFSGGIATGRGAFDAAYSGTYTDVLGDWALATRASVRSAGNVTNFYGLGNDTDRDDGTPKLFETGLGQAHAEIPLVRQHEMGATFEAGPTLDVAWIDGDRAQNLVGLEQPGLSTPTTETQLFAGARARLGLAYRDDATNPRAGYAWSTSVEGNLGVVNAPDDYATVTSALALYASLPTAHQATLAVRAGGAHNLGAFPFYTASTLGGTANLRGFRSTRFSGRTSLYANAELRLALFRVTWAALPGRVGALGFVDHGRVWTDGERSDTWHRGYGGGLWYDVVDEVVVRVSYGVSEDDTYLLTGLGFLF